MIDELALTTKVSQGAVTAPHAAMLIGDTVTYRGRRYVVVGVTPFSVTPFQVELEDPESKRTFWTDWPPERPQRAALRLADHEAESSGKEGGDE